MDYSQFRRSGAIDTGPLADAQDWFNSTGVGKVANAVGGGNDDNRWASLADPNNGFQQGSLADQLGGNQVMDSGQQSSTPDDTGYDDQGGITQNPSPVGEILGNETDESGGYDSGGNWQGLDYGYAEGGAVNDDTDDGRAVPKGAAQDQHTDGLASALQTIDDVMMHGYKINGLTGQSQQMPQSASAGGAQAPAFARGGLVPNAPGTITPPSFTGTPYQNFMASARQRATAARSQPMPSASPSAPTPTVPTNGTGVQDPAQSGQAIGGTAIAPGTYQGHRFDDGGAVEDDDQQGAIPDQPGQAPQQAQPQPQDDPNGGWQGGIPTMDNIRNSMRGAPSPADAMVPHVKRILNLIQGGGAMPIPQAQQLEHQSGEADPNMAKIKTAATLAQSHGPDAAWSYLQSLRKQYDLNKTNAAVKAAKGNIPQSTIAATNAMHNVLDGTSVHFSPAQGGVRVQVKRIGPSSGSSSQRFDDGGSVEDANGNDAQPISDKPSGAIPETGGADISGALASVGHTIADQVLSIPQYISLLRGRLGQYDEVWNNGVAGALKAASSRRAEMDTNLRKQAPSGASGFSEEEVNQPFPTPPGPSMANRVGTALSGGPKIGSEEEEQDLPKRTVPMPQARPQEATDAEREADATTVPTEGQGDKNAPVQPFSKETEQQAWRLYPNIFGDAAKRAEYVRSQGEEETKHQNKLEENEAVWGHKTKIAELVGGNKMTIQDMKSKMNDRTQAAMTARALKIADMKVNMGRESNLSKEFNSYVQSGQIGKMPPALMQQALDTINHVSAREQQEDRGSSPVQIQQATNPNAPTQGGPVTQVMRGPDGQLHTFVQTADGKFVPQQR